MSSQQILKLHESDNIAVALRQIESHTALAPTGLNAVDKIPSGHKVAMESIAAGQQITKYGQIIGVATQDIPAGSHVHVHNVAMASVKRSETFGSR